MSRRRLLSSASLCGPLPPPLQDVTNSPGDHQMKRAAGGSNKRKYGTASLSSSSSSLAGAAQKGRSSSRGKTKQQASLRALPIPRLKAPTSCDSLSLLSCSPLPLPPPAKKRTTAKKAVVKAKAKGGGKKVAAKGKGRSRAAAAKNKRETAATTETVAAVAGRATRSRGGKGTTVVAKPLATTTDGSDDGDGEQTRKPRRLQASALARKASRNSTHDSTRRSFSLSSNSSASPASSCCSVASADVVQAQPSKKSRVGNKDDDDDDDALVNGGGGLSLKERLKKKRDIMRQQQPQQQATPSPVSQSHQSLPPAAPAVGMLASSSSTAGDRNSTSVEENQDGNEKGTQPQEEHDDRDDDADLGCMGDPMLGDDDDDWADGAMHWDGALSSPIADHASAEEEGGENENGGGDHCRWQAALARVGAGRHQGAQWHDALARSVQSLLRTQSISQTRPPVSGAIFRIMIQCLELEFLAEGGAGDAGDLFDAMQSSLLPFVSHVVAAEILVRALEASEATRVSGSRKKSPVPSKKQVSFCAFDLSTVSPPVEADPGSFLSQDRVLCLLRGAGDARRALIGDVRKAPGGAAAKLACAASSFLKTVAGTSASPTSRETALAAAIVAIDSEGGVAAALSNGSSAVRAVCRAFSREFDFEPETPAQGDSSFGCSLVERRLVQHCSSSVRFQLRILFNPLPPPISVWDGLEPPSVRATQGTRGDVHLVVALGDPLLGCGVVPQESEAVATCIPADFSAADDSDYFEEGEELGVRPRWCNAELASQISRALVQLEATSPAALRCPQEFSALRLDALLAVWSGAMARHFLKNLLEWPGVIARLERCNQGQTLRALEESASALGDILGNGEAGGVAGPFTFNGGDVVEHATHASHFSALRDMKGLLRTLQEWEAASPAKVAAAGARSGVVEFVRACSGDAVAWLSDGSSDEDGVAAAVATVKAGGKRGAGRKAAAASRFLVTNADQILLQEAFPVLVRPVID